MTNATMYANRGKDFENTLKDMHALYRGRGHMVIRFPTPLKITGRRGDTFTAIPEEQGCPDFLVCASGYDFLVDAKETVQDSWDLKNLKVHQADSFDLWTSKGSNKVSGIILWMRPRAQPSSIWWVDWKVLGPVWRRWSNGLHKRGDASLSQAWLQANARKTSADWLSAALAGRP